jgi:hypothetical protein
MIISSQKGKEAVSPQAPSIPAAEYDKMAYSVPYGHRTFEEGEMIVE